MKNDRVLGNVAATGHLYISHTNLFTNETTVELDERNLIVDTGFELIPRALNPLMDFGAKMGELRFGNDTGIGNELQPSLPTKDIQPNEQHVVAVVPTNEINYITSSDSITISISILGRDLLQGRDFLKYTSAAIYTDDGKIFSYKRFPFRVISPDVRVNVTWKISFGDGGNGGTVEPCPIPPKITGTIIETASNVIVKDEGISIRGFEVYDDNSLKVVRNGSKWVTNNDGVELSSSLNGSVRVTGKTVGATIVQLKSGEYVTSAIFQVVEPVIVQSLTVNTVSLPTDLYIGAQITVQATHIQKNKQTNVTGASDWSISPNLTLMSKTETEAVVRIDDLGESYIIATYNGLTDTFQFAPTVKKAAIDIQLLPLDNTRFAVGDTLTFTPTVYFNDGTSRLANLTDRWVYDSRLVKLDEVGTLGNLRLTAKYKGVGSIRVYIDGVEGKLEFLIADPIITNSVYAYPQTPLHVIPNVHNYGAKIMGRQSEGQDMEIDNFYMTTSAAELTLDGGIKVVGDGQYNIIVNKDEVVNHSIQVISTTLTTVPLEMIVGEFEYIDLDSGTIEIEIVNPTSSGVYIDISDNVRRYYDTTETVSIVCSPTDIIKVYGGADSIKVVGPISEIVTWGEFECDGFQITSTLLTRVPYVAPNVLSMENMFRGCSSLNQDLSAWCVSGHTSQPAGFDDGCTSWVKMRPIWGTCPNVDDVTSIIMSTNEKRTIPIGETVTISVSGINRMEEEVTHSDTLYTLTYNDSVILVTSLGNGVYEIAGLTAGTSTLEFSTGHATATIECEVI